jgi:hypothetical protein
MRCLKGSESVGLNNPEAMTLTSVGMLLGL